MSLRCRGAIAIGLFPLNAQGIETLRTLEDFGPTVVRLNVFETPADVARAAVEHFIAASREAIATRGRFAVALSGGSTPRKTYELLATEELPWEAIHVFFADERCVPTDDARSNYRLIYESLISRVSLPPANVHRMRGEVVPDTGARLYEADLRTYFSNKEWPGFDLATLGLGVDGHIASLFRGTKALQETTAWVVANRAPDDLWRLTLTLPVINHSHSVLFLVTGADKAGAVSQTLREPSLTSGLPAQNVQPIAGECVWLMDKAAASSI
ncbi:MAG: 6-phosphogluconolactonase [Pyrinomonadaceae bacterium]